LPEKLKIVFVTLVYDGMPFLRHHPTVFEKLGFAWEWHVVEGLALLRHDTAWSLRRGGRVPAWAMKNSLSTDGTTKFLDELQKANPSRIFIYRKPVGQFWDGKIEMERVYLSRLKEPCLLWEISSDELWSCRQIESVVRLFEKNPRRSGAYFWCNFYVGPNAVVSSRNGYSQNPKLEWLRVYRYEPGDNWQSHEPNVLTGKRTIFRRKVDVGAWRPFIQKETEAVGAVFDHFPYATNAQVRFKEAYYGYHGLTKKWIRLQRDVQRQSPRHLSRYFPWVEDNTTVSTPEAMGLKPMARELRGKWIFRSSSRLAVAPLAGRQILLHEGWLLAAEKGLGRARLLQVLKQWAKTGFSRYLQVLEGQKQGPSWPGLKSIRTSKARFLSGPLAGLLMERICRRYRIDMMVLGSDKKPLLTKSLTMRFNKDRQFSFKFEGITEHGNFPNEKNGHRSAKALRRLFEEALLRKPPEALSTILRR
jgi:hypothetical protein